MKKVLFVLMALCLVSSLAFAAESTSTKVTTVAATAAMDANAVVATDTAIATPVVTPEAIALKGDIIDNACAGTNKDTLAEFVKTHTKECALKPGCVDSGYSIYADGKLYAFDKDSNAKVVEFLKQADSKLQVAITARQVGDELNLVSIKNQN